MPVRILPDQSVLLALLKYDPSTGLLFWRDRSPAIFASSVVLSPSCVSKRWNTRYASKEAFATPDNEGYRAGKLFGRTNRAHRVIWKMMTGREAKIVDHINGDRSDNRWSNLRSTDDTGNARNSAIPRTNTSGHAGVSFNRSQRKWRAYICRQYIGSFLTFHDAVAARKQAEVRYSFHPNHGRAAI